MLVINFIIENHLINLKQLEETGSDKFIHEG